MKKVYLIAMVFCTSLFISCESKKERHEVAEPEYISPNAEFEEDLGISGIVISSNNFQVSLLTESGDSCSFSIESALENKMVFGGINQDDQVLVIPGLQGVADKLYNITTLMGRWVRKNVADEDSGLELRLGGTCRSINSDTQSYQSWEMNGDRLLLTWVSDGSGSTSQITDTCEIEKLTKDSLSLVFHYSGETPQHNLYIRQK